MIYCYRLLNKGFIAVYLRTSYKSFPKIVNDLHVFYEHDTVIKTIFVSRIFG